MNHYTYQDNEQLRGRGGMIAMLIFSMLFGSIAPMIGEDVTFGELVYITIVTVFLSPTFLLFLYACAFSRCSRIDVWRRVLLGVFSVNYLMPLFNDLVGYGYRYGYDVNEALLETAMHLMFFTVTILALCRVRAAAITIVAVTVELNHCVIAFIKAIVAYTDNAGSWYFSPESYLSDIMYAIAPMFLSAALLIFVAANTQVFLRYRQYPAEMSMSRPSVPDNTTRDQYRFNDGFSSGNRF